jgi:AcrR family transcriptional regulator
MTPTAEATDTRLRLLEAAGEIFAADGYAQATVRDICNLAEANIAAVNYHFGGKRGLYAAVFQHAASCGRIALPKIGDGAQPEAQLRAAVSALLSCVFDSERPAWYGKLMIREMVEPTPVLDSLVETNFRPLYEALHDIVDRLSAGRLKRPALGRCVRSLIAQCAYYHHARAVVTRLEPKLRFDAAEIARLADHIVDFTIGGIQRVGGGGR